ncbi:MAG: hypothetical protein J7497_05275, partial [Chitinophagaceae bacterium]|nr:hypothetical protein [Chitinophagaceae bacterium]
MQYKFVLKTFLVSFFLFAFGKAGLSQTLNGPQCVQPYQENMYYVQNSDPGGYYEWNISGGESIDGNSWEGGEGLYYLLVRFYSSGGSISVSAPNGGAYISVSAGAPLNPGSIVSNGTQTINYNHVPASIGCSAATDGGCLPSYSYQWEKSTDGTNWSNVSGETSQNLSFSLGLTQTTYFRRKVTEAFSGVAYSNTATVYVNQPLSAGTIGASQNIFSGNTPSTLTGGDASGGGCGQSYSYQWQSSTDNISFNVISGATGKNYSPGALTATTYYRRKVTCSPDEAYTSSVAINIHQHLSGNYIGPSYSSTLYNTSPGQLLGSMPSGGICGGYSYQWQSSSNNSTWSNINGAIGQNYTPGNLTVNTYYRRKVSCGSEEQTSNVSFLFISLSSGTVSGGISPVSHVNSPGELSVTSASYGDCGGSYTYQWEESIDGTSFTPITGATGLTYTPILLPAGTYYYRNTVTCSGVSASSNIRTITVYPQLHAGSVTTESFDYFPTATPQPIDATASSGGNCTNYTYQWERSIDNITFESVPGASTSQNYSFPGVPTQSYYYRRKTTCGTDIVYTNSISVSLFCNAGAVSCSQVITTGGTASAFTLTNTSGGGPGVTPTFQWESSSDEITWTIISGATGTTYTPSSPTSTTYYRVKVTFGTRILYANTVRVKVKETITNNSPNSSTATSNQSGITMPAYPTGTDANNQNYLRTRTFAKPGITDLTTANTQTGNSDVAQVT